MKYFLTLSIFTLLLVACNQDVECKYECTTGETRCKDEKTLQYCSTKNGCTNWITETCLDVELCSDRYNDTYACVPNISITSCTEGGNECFYNTNGKTTCINNECVITDSCTPNTQRCFEDTIQICTDDGVWETTDACYESQVCNPLTFSCEDLDCTNDCTLEGATQCKDRKIVQTCNLQESGCYKWTDETCSGEDVCSEKDYRAYCTQEIIVEICTDEDEEIIEFTCKDNTNGKTICYGERCIHLEDWLPCDTNGCYGNKITECSEDDNTILKTCRRNQTYNCLEWIETTCTTECIQNEETANCN
jgi:hypothetical protein